MASREYFHQEPPAAFESTCIDYLLPPVGQKTACDPAALGNLFGLKPPFDPET